MEYTCLHNVGVWCIHMCIHVGTVMCIVCVTLHKHFFLCLLYTHLFLLSGLQLTWGEHNSPLKRAFTYALCPLTQGINPVKKKVLVTDEVEGDHVRVHELQPTEKLAESVAGYRKNKSTKAVVILNTADGLMLDPAHVEGLESSNFPLVVVSQSDGQELKGILDQQDDVLCDINVESTVDHPTQPQTEQGIAGGVTAPQDNKTSSMSCVYAEV